MRTIEETAELVESVLISAGVTDLLLIERIRVSLILRAALECLEAATGRRTIRDDLGNVVTPGAIVADEEDVVGAIRAFLTDRPAPQPKSWIDQLRDTLGDDGSEPVRILIGTNWQLIGGRR